MNKVYDFISEYNGGNSFINSLKAGYSKYGKLTASQISAAERIIDNITEKVKTMAPIEVQKNIKQIMDYSGDNKFVNDLKSKYQKYGKLTEKQIDAGLKMVNRTVQNTLAEPMKFPKKETITIRQFIARDIKDRMGLNFLPIQIDVTHLIGASRKAVHLRGKLSTEVGDVCRCCGRALTDELSILTGMGKTCAKKTGVIYAKDRKDIDRFKNDLEIRVNEIGEFDFWIPKNQVQEWDGVYKIVLKSPFKTYVVQEW